MKAIVCSKYGLSELKLEEIEAPILKENDVLLEVYASSVTMHNLVTVKGKPYFIRLMGNGFLKPKIRIPGTDIAGRVVETGSNVKHFQVGDEVFGTLCSFGAFAEYASVPEDIITHKPTTISFEEAATIPQAALVALQALRDKGNIQKGQKVLIIGASGGIGTFAIQLAKFFETEVTGVCSTQNKDMVYSLGADHVIDYTKEDFTKRNEKYDLVLGIAYRSIFAIKNALNTNGIYVSTGSPSMGRVFQDVLIGPWLLRIGGKKMIGGWEVLQNVKDLVFMKELIESGKVKPVVDRTYSLKDASAAFKYYEQGHAKGKVIVLVKH